MDDLLNAFALSKDALGYLTSAVQFGFIFGTLCFALLTIADRYSPSRVFMFSAFFGALFNMLTVLEGNTVITLGTLRFLTGFFLAGIYPVGMKIAADYHQKGLGKALGYLVGALVVGTALPHLLKGLTEGLSWKIVLLTTSLLAILGGLLTGCFVKDGPFRKAMSKMDLSVVPKIFKNRSFSAAALGYFGHMWELYAFWAFVPFMFTTFVNDHPESFIHVPISSFVVIGIGGVACVLSGYISLGSGPKKTAIAALALSGLCCFLSPFVLSSDSSWLLIIFLLFWGMVVIADSPMFSTLVAQSAEPETKGTALTIVNCIGFAITIVSIQLLNGLAGVLSANYLYLFLGIGPIFGLVAIVKQVPKSSFNRYQA